MEDFMYNSLPEVYRILDVNQKLILKRFLSVIQEGGFEPVLDYIVQFADSNNVDDLDEDGLRLLGRTFGYEYNYILPIENQRKLIKNIVEIYRRKGTTSSVIYAAKEITGFDTQITHLHSKMFRTWSSDKHYEIPGYEQPKTYSGIGNTNASCFPGTKFSKTNVLIKLIPLFDIGLQYERSTALQEVLKMLLPVYTKTFLLLSHTEKDLEDKTCDFFEHFTWDNIIFREDGVLTNISDIENILTKIKEQAESRTLTKLESFVEAIKFAIDSDTRVRNFLLHSDVFKLKSGDLDDFNKSFDYSESISKFSIVETEPKTISKSETITQIIKLILEDYTVDNLVSRTVEDSYLNTIPEAVEEDIVTESLHDWQQNTGEEELPFSLLSADMESRTRSTAEADVALFKTLQFSEDGLKQSYLQFSSTSADSCYTQGKISGAGAKTIEMIIAPTDANDAWDRIIQRANDDGYGFSIRQVGTRFYGQFREFNGGDGECFSVKTDVDCDLTGQTDYHIILTWDGSTAPKMYVNKIVQTLNEFDTAGGGSGNGLFLARMANEESYFWNGKIKHLAIWNKHMTQTDVNNRTNSPKLGGNETNLLGYWPFDERSGTIVRNVVNANTNVVQNSDFKNGLDSWVTGCRTIAETPVYVTNGQGVTIDESKSYSCPKSCKLIANRTTQYFTHIRQLLLINQTEKRNLIIKARVSGENLGADTNAVLGGYFHYTDGSGEWNPTGMLTTLQWNGIGTFDWTEREFLFIAPKPVEFIWLEPTIENTGGGNPEAIMWIDNVEVIQRSATDLVAQGTWVIDNTIKEVSHSDYITRKVVYQNHTNGPSGSNFGFVGLTGVTDRNTNDLGGGAYTLTYQVNKFRVSNIDYVALTIKRGVDVLAQSQDIPETQAGDSFILVEQNDSGVAGTVSQGAWSWDNVNGTINFILA